jgi:hypothetical protein
MQDSNEVVVTSTLKLRVHETGKRLERPLVQIVGVDRDAGVIKYMRPFYWDVKGLREDVGK